MSLKSKAIILDLYLGNLSMTPATYLLPADTISLILLTQAISSIDLTTEIS